MRRAGFKAMLEAVARREADVVIVHTLDRWARNVLVTLTAFKTLGDVQCGVSLNENIDYSTPEGRIFLIMLAAFAQYFSDSLGKHASKAKRARARLGLPLGRVPFGYRSEGGKAARVDEEAAALRQLVFAPFLTGHCDFKTLAQNMNDAGWFTRSANIMARQRAAGEEELGGRWKADTVRFILRTRSTLVSSDSTTRAVVTGQHEPILTTEEFQAIQTIIQERRATKAPFPSQTQRRPDKFRSYALRGLLHCIFCGTSLAGVANRKRANSAERRRYVFYCGKRGANCSATGATEYTLGGR
jgi:site-specific DNA recombinase